MSASENYAKLGRRDLRDAIQSGWRWIRWGETWTKTMRHPVTGLKVLTVKRADRHVRHTDEKREEWREVLRHMRCQGLKGGPEFA